MLPNVNYIPTKSSRRRLDFLLANDSYQIKWEGGEKTESIASKLLASDALNIYNQAVESDKKYKVQACNVLLPEKMILNRVVTLPLATEKNIDNVIAYEMDRYTPFKREDVYFDAQVQSKDKAEKKISVLLRVIKKSTISELLRFIEDSQLSIENIYCVDVNSKPIGDALKFGDILNSSAGKNSNNSTNRYLLVLVGILTVVALILPIAKNYWNAQKYNAELESINPEIVEVKKLLSTYKEMKRDIDLSADLNKKNVKAIVLLSDLTSIISDDTSLSRLSVEDGIVRMQGASVSASKLISALDSTQKFTDVKFAAPVTQNSASGNENFTIQMRLKIPENGNAAVK
ncbi:MAG: PilN domain-containing protein [Gammaproteobacteria bacterium]